MASASQVYSVPELIVVSGPDVISTAKGGGALPLTVTVKDWNISSLPWLALTTISSLPSETPVIVNVLPVSLVLKWVNEA